MALSVVIAQKYHCEIAERIGGYKFERILHIGCDTVTAVFTHERTATEYASKIISRQYLVDENLVELFQHELTVFASLNQENVVQFVEVQSDDNLVYVMMEYCVKGDFHRFLNLREPVSDREAKMVLWQVLTGVSYLHSHKICHRNIKLENLLLGNGRKIKIADFGFTNDRAGKGPLLSQQMLPEFVAPEVLMNNATSGYAADMWSVGVVLFVIMFGKLPWENGTTRTGLIFDIQSAKFEVPRFRGEMCASLIEGLMHSEALMRLTAEQALTHPWFKEEAPCLGVQRSEKRMPVVEKSFCRRSLVMQRNMPSHARDVKSFADRVNGELMS